MAEENVSNPVIANVQISLSQQLLHDLKNDSTETLDAFFSSFQSSSEKDRELSLNQLTTDASLYQSLLECIIQSSSSSPSLSSKMNFFLGYVYENSLFKMATCLLPALLYTVARSQSSSPSSPSPASSVSAAEALLLGIIQFSSSSKKSHAESIVPSLSSPSIFHKPQASSAAEALTETALRKHNQDRQPSSSVASISSNSSASGPEGAIPSLSQFSDLIQRSSAAFDKHIPCLPELALHSFVVVTRRIMECCSSSLFPASKHSIRPAVLFSTPAPVSSSSYSPFVSASPSMFADVRARSEERRLQSIHSANEIGESSFEFGSHLESIFAPLSSRSADGAAAASSSSSSSSVTFTLSPSAKHALAATISLIVSSKSAVLSSSACALSALELLKSWDAREPQSLLLVKLALGQHS